MSATRILTPILVALVAAAAFATTPAGAVIGQPGESPDDGDCDATGLLACAGLDVGADVQCAVDGAGNVACAYTYGWISTAYSPVGIPGEETHIVTATITTCIIGSGPESCSAQTREHGDACAWVGPMTCDDSGGPNPGSVSAALAMGECARVTVTMHGVIDARAFVGTSEAASVHFENVGEGAGAACFLDDGRG